MLVSVNYFDVFEKSLFMLIKATYFIRNALKTTVILCYYFRNLCWYGAIIINVENSSA